MAAKLSVSRMNPGLRRLILFGGDVGSLMHPRAALVVLMLCVYAAFGGISLWMGLSVQHAAVLVAAMLAVTGAFWQRV